MMRHRNNFFQNNRALVGAAIGLCGLIGFQLLFPLILPQFLFQVATPIVRVWTGTTDWLAHGLSAFASKQKLLDENKSLNAELASAQEKLLTLSALQTDNQRLQELYGRTKPGKGILAAVLLSPPLSPYDTLVLDAGAREGISVGDMVRSTNGSPLGRITEVFRDFSRVELFSTPGTETAVRIGEKGVQGKAMGMGGGEFEILLPREFTVIQGEPIVFPELSVSPFGVVQSVEYQETDFLQTIHFRSSVNVRELSHVLIDISPNSTSINENSKNTP